MLFHTWPFLLFFVVVYGVYLAALRTRYWLPWLLVASYAFYAFWSPLYLPLILYSTVVDYFAVWRMEAGRRRRLWLVLSVANHLLLLGFFKYAMFATVNANAILEFLRIPLVIPKPGVLLPVGISFYTFQALGYVIDCYRGQVPRERCFVRFATFVSFFPQLLAGPIGRAGQLLPQLSQAPRITSEDLADGASLFAVGLFKKVALTDYLAIYVNLIYATPESQSAPALLLATFAFAWQIYFDFSGYTDMARGVARMMGLRLMLNFCHPYLATSVGDFWSRWHISLSTWFRDYVYIPLGGNRCGTLVTYRNLFLTFVISGLWHGAAWTYVIWGALHGLGAIATRQAERSGWYEHVPRALRQAILFLFVCVTWVFFRANSLGDACVILERMVVGGWQDPACPLLALALILAIWLYQFLFESRLRGLIEFAPVKIGLVVAMLVYLSFFAGSAGQPFIYLQF